MPTWGIVLLVIALVIVLVIGFIAGIYNSLVQLDERVNEAWSDITVQLKYRADLIPNVLETVKGYAKHEKETFQMVTEARTAAMGAKTVNHGDAGFEFHLIGGYRMQILVWAGDDEFPPSAQILYSDNFTAFAAEDRVVAGDILITQIKMAM